MTGSRFRATQKAPKVAKKSVLPVHFGADALTRVSRGTLKAMAKRLGFNETQTVHYALAYLKREVESASAAREREAAYPALTDQQIEAVRKSQPKRKKAGVIDSLIR
jgi:hypothetical protein